MLKKSSTLDKVFRISQIREHFHNLRNVISPCWVFVFLRWSLISWSCSGNWKEKVKFKLAPMFFSISSDSFLYSMWLNRYLPVLSIVFKCKPVISFGGNCRLLEIWKTILRPLWMPFVMKEEYCPINLDFPFPFFWKRFLLLIHVVVNRLIQIISLSVSMLRDSGSKSDLP